MQSNATNMSSKSTVACFLATACLFLFLPAQAEAGAIAVVLCSVVNIMLGTFGRALATLAIMFIGIGATLGKVSWGMAITVAVGISVMLGAPSVLLALTGFTSGC